jgi:hypothetical protein
LYIPLGLPLIHAVVTNNPGSFLQVVSALIYSLDRVESPERIVSILTELSALSRHHPPHIRSILVQKKILPGLIMTLTSSIGDVVSFFTNVFTIRDVSRFVREHIVSSQEGSNAGLQKIREDLMLELKKDCSQVCLGSLLKVICCSFV